MLKKLIILCFSLFFLFACGGESKQALSGDQVINAFQDAGIEIIDVKENTRNPESPLPQSFNSNWSFVDVKLSTGNGGQVFTCDQKSHCDAIYAYFDALKALAGPYLYRNADGTVVVQLNSGHTPDSANKYKSVVSGL